MKISCYKCQTELNLNPNENIARSTECTNCYSDLRCCKMCAFYDKNSYNECRESSASRILDKEKANFCDYFKVASTKGNSEKKDDILANANALFKK